MSSMTLSIVDSQPCKLSKRYCKRKKNKWLQYDKDTVQKQYEEKRKKRKYSGIHNKHY